MERNQGFTLIELMVTIAVLAIIAMMAAPSFLKIIRKSQLNSDTREFVNLLTEKRSEAIFKQNDRVLTLDSSISCIEPNCTIWSIPKHILKVHGDASITFNRLGQSTIAEDVKGQCFVFKHYDDASLKSYVYVQKGGTIFYDKTATSCPT